VSVGGPKPRALLAQLALDVGRVVSVDRIVEELWPGSPPETATHAVQVYVSQLRKALGEVISRQGPGYVLDLDPNAIDLHRFAQLAHDGHEELRAGQEAAAAETLRSALSLWRGPALADFAYEPFAQSEIARLDELRFAALEDRIEADLAVGRHAELVTEIEALVESQPLRERPRALLMRALYLAGRQADALAAYRAARETLVEELGIEPGPELRELEAAILRQDESLRPATVSATRTRRLAAILSVAIDEVGSVDLETEDRDLELLSATVASAASRHGGVAERLADGSAIAVFGVPVTHEDDPLRAARAAIDVRDALVSVGSIAFAAAIDVGEVVSADRSASGPPLRSAAKLRLEAGRGEILVSAAAARRITHAARLEARGDVSALVELGEAAQAFERRLDTPFVGRDRELRALRDALRRTRQDGAAHGVLVIGPAGIGKSRLVSELTRRARGITVLSGRCLSYGDGITYWPLHEMLRGVGTSAERDAVLEALDAATPPQAAEIALLFRRLCEALARLRPLVLVFDDLHWAEPTLLDLVDHVVSKAEGPVLAVGVAREELDESDDDFLAARPNVSRVDLGGLPEDETQALLDGLDGSVLDPEQRDRLVEIAGGNPFFLEQLVALALEGGLVERPLPETVQALLSTRLDRLGPGERAVLERGAVIGKEFTGADVVSLLEPAAAGTAGAHLATLAERGLVEPGDDDGYGFRHLLVQEAVYRSAPKRLRAELHERFADRLDTVYADLPDLDEFVGFHLDQAYRLRIELGESDRRTSGLAEDAGRRLGEAGFRSLKRGDASAAVSLLARATTLLPQGAHLRLDLRNELGVAQQAAGDPKAASTTFSETIAESVATDQRGPELRARIERAYMDLLANPEGAAEALLEIVDAALPTLEALGDPRSLARAWLLVGYVRGGIQGNHAAWEAAEERALAYYRQTPFPPATCLGQIAAALYWGPTPVDKAIARCTELLADESIGSVGRAAVLPYLGGLEAQLGRFAKARKLVAEATSVYKELGARAGAMTHCGTVLADIELMAANYAAAESTLREQCRFFEGAGDRSHLAVRAAKLADALARQERLDDAEQWLRVATETATAGDQSAQLVLRAVEARLLSRRGALAGACTLAQETVRLADGTDGSNRRADARLVLAEILLADGLSAEAGRAIAEAIAIFESKGNVVGAARARELASIHGGE
jgi:DNA-binding SARP family transcriptional activator